MFESSLLPGRKGSDARLLRFVTIGSVALQAAVVTTFVVLPLLYPDTIPLLVHPPRLTHVELLRPAPKPVPIKPLPKPVAITNPTAIAVPVHSTPMLAETRQGGRISTVLTSPIDETPRLALGGGNVMGSGFNAAVGFGARTGSGSSPVVVAAKPETHGETLRVSSGVSRGLLLAPMQPHYPPIALAARVEGIVTVTAVIDRNGRIVNAQAVDGPLMLRDAALSAVRDARYRPYLLNGQPTEVVTTVSVNFRLST